MRILVSGGGSAGHISPVLATLEVLKSLDKTTEILYVGTASGMEAKIAHASGWKFAAISAGKFRRLHQAKWWQHFQDLETLALNGRDIFRLFAGFWQALRILGQFQPDVIFIKGGYVGLPVGLAAAAKRIPFLVHESDLVPGLTNRVLARWAKAVAVGWPVQRYRGWHEDKIIHTGNPVRSDMVKAHRLEGLTRFKLSQELPVVLVTGGSLGAIALNDAVLGALGQLLAYAQVIHITGERDIERVKYEYKRLKLKHSSHYKPFAFLREDMALAMAAADVVVSRAGANTLSELALLAKPAIVVPNRTMAGHQVENALALARSGAIRVLQEERLTPQALAAEVEKVLTSEKEQKLLSAAIVKVGVPDAAERLADLIVKVANDARR